jgi:hypothetical protein
MSALQAAHPSVDGQAGVLIAKLRKGQELNLRCIAVRVRAPIALQQGPPV